MKVSLLVLVYMLMFNLHCIRIPKTLWITLARSPLDIDYIIYTCMRTLIIKVR